MDIKQVVSDFSAIVTALAGTALTVLTVIEKYKALKSK